jgi:hypothetical protein
MKNSRAGLSFVEVLVAAVVLGVIIGIATGGILNLQRARVRQTSLNTNDKQVDNLIKNIRNNINLYIVSYGVSASSTNAREKLAALKKSGDLPVAWSGSVISTPQNCERCPGRMGFVILPMIRGGGVGNSQVLPGLYKVTMLLSHQDLFPEGKYYEFVASGAKK